MGKRECIEFWQTAPLRRHIRLQPMRQPGTRYPSTPSLPFAIYLPRSPLTHSFTSPTLSILPNLFQSQKLTFHGLEFQSRGLGRKRHFVTLLLRPYHKHHHRRRLHPHHHPLKSLPHHSPSPTPSPPPPTSSPTTTTTLKLATHSKIAFFESVFKHGRPCRLVVRIIRVAFK